MNILEAFDAALPEIPAKSARKSYPKLDPRVISREHVEYGLPTILAKMPGYDSYVRFTPQQWALLEAFDGKRSYEEIAELMQEQGLPFSVDDVREFASYMQDKTDFFYRTPLEKNITLKQKMGAHRHKRKKFSISNFAEITLYRWPHADDYLTTLHPYVKWMYEPWCVWVVLACYVVMAGMWAGKFGEIWRDSFQFYNFAGKTAWDIVEFWFLFGAMAFFHETAHGMTCKEFGGKVERIEFQLMFFSPTFMCDVTQIWILGDRKARLSTIIAGIYFDLIICFFATTVWWITPPGIFLHDFAYKVIMVTGIGVTLLNLNPLIKLDGYYIFSEVIGEAELYELSAAYVSSWFKKHILRLPVEVEFVPRRRRVLYLVYSMLSQAYGTLLLVVVAIFFYHIIRSFSPDYAWIPGWGIGFYMFRTKIRELVRLMKNVYLDKKDRVRAWFTPARIATCAAVMLALLFTPVWPDFVEGRFVLEPAKKAVVRTQMPGIVARVNVSENERVQAGSELVQLENLDLESEAAQANAGYREASARAIGASLRYTDYGRAQHEQAQSAVRDKALATNLAELNVTSPISGTVLTPRLQDLEGTYLDAGAMVAEVADLSKMRARIYIPEFGVRDVKVGTRTRLQLESKAWPLTGQLASVAPVSSEIDAGLTDQQQLSGIVPPPFYVGFVELPNDGSLREGMSGMAKMYVRRRSVAAIAARFTRDLVDGRFW